MIEVTNKKTTHFHTKIKTNSAGKSRSSLVPFDAGHLRLSDFGLSRRLKRGGRAFTICGTMQYMGELSAEHPGGSNMFDGRVSRACWFTTVRQRRDPFCMFSFRLDVNDPLLQLCVKFPRPFWRCIIFPTTFSVMTS